MNKQELLRSIYKVDEVLQDEHLIFLKKSLPYSLIADTVREEIQNLRQFILTHDTIPETLNNQELFIEQVIQKLHKKSIPSLRRIINATGTILHTNLGRSCLSPEIGNRVLEIACNYSTLEYNTQKGKRGSRHNHVERLITQITGAEAAMVVNNNAAATMLVLSTMASNKEVIVSRGELVEIGGSFRIPDIMSLSGAKLKEIGTTNKTHLRDYLNAYDPDETAALMKVHTSNYKIIGFTEDVSLEDLVKVGHQHHTPVIYDMGNGLLMNLETYGIHEPTVTDAVKAGADVILFSGDKLLGGPQAGIIIGKKKFIEQMKAHPLARVARIDKMTLAALEATFFEYLDFSRACDNLPVLKMLTTSLETLQQNAELLLTEISQKTSQFTLEILPCEDFVGGGSAPDTRLDGYAIALQSAQFSAERIENHLRKQELSIITHTSHDKVLLHIRTIMPKDFTYIAETISQII